MLDSKGSLQIWGKNLKKHIHLHINYEVTVVNECFYFHNKNNISFTKTKSISEKIYTINSNELTLNNN